MLTVTVVVEKKYPLLFHKSQAKQTRKTHTVMWDKYLSWAMNWKNSSHMKNTTPPYFNDKKNNNNMYCTGRLSVRPSSMTSFNNRSFHPLNHCCSKLYDIALVLKTNKNKVAEQWGWHSHHDIAYLLPLNPSEGWSVKDTAKSQHRSQVSEFKCCCIGGLLLVSFKKGRL